MSKPEKTGKNHLSLELLITFLGCDVHCPNKHAKSLQKLTSPFVSAATEILSVTDPLPALLYQQQGRNVLVAITVESLSSIHGLCFL